jgi:hypothetical protein
MSTADPLARLTHEIGLRTYADRFLDLAEENEVRAIGGRVGLTEADLDREIGRVCREQGTDREREIRVAVRGLIARECGSGRIDEAAFHRIVAGLATAAPMTERTKQKLVLTVMEESGRANIKRGWFSNWHASLKQSLGLPPG